MRVIFAYADYAEGLNTSVWRVFIPVEALKRAGHKVEVISVEELVKGTHHHRPENFDVLVIERELFSCSEVIEKWPIPVIATFDDAYHLIPPTVPSFPTWRKGDALKNFRKCLRQVDAYITPSPLLTEDFKHINSHGHTIRNYPDLSWDCWKAERKPHKGIRIGWGGSISHYDSWMYSGIVPAVRRILADFPETSLTIVSGDMRLIDLFSGLDYRRFRYKDTMPFEKWPSQLASWDIGLAPLHGEYDRRRSWIKALEYCIMGVVPVVSDVEPYQDCPVFARVRGDKPLNWYNAIRDAIKVCLLGKEDLIRKNREWALKQGIDGNVGLYRSALEETIERKTRLAHKA